jgi:two-component system sensor histidine kinase RegB
VAISGQISALLYTYFILKLAIPIGPALFVIGLAVAMNMWQTRRTMITRRKDDQNFPALTFDVLQLALLLFFTGGLLNPFSILVLAPVFISATILRRREALMLGGVVLLCVCILAIYNYPLPWGDGPILEQRLYLTGLWLSLSLSAVFIGLYAWGVASHARRLGEALSQAKIAFAEEQQAVALGALATSAAHKLGSPLNTITVITHELEREMHRDDPILEDIQLLRTEAERCRLILRELDEYKLVENLDKAAEVTIEALITEILDERIEKNEVGFSVTFESGKFESGKPHSADACRKLLVRRRPEVVQALDDVLRNAANFAVSQVTIMVLHTEQDLRITVVDDGSGFSEGVLARAGEPWNTTRLGIEGHRGLGIFIAQTLIEAVGGSILFRNTVSGGGEVRIILPVPAIAGAGEE